MLLIYRHIYDFLYEDIVEYKKELRKTKSPEDIAINIPSPDELYIHNLFGGELEPPDPIIGNPAATEMNTSEVDSNSAEMISIEPDSGVDSTDSDSSEPSINIYEFEPDSGFKLDKRTVRNLIYNTLNTIWSKELGEEVPYNALIPEIEKNKTYIGLIFQTIPLKSFKKGEMEILNCITDIDSNLNELLIHIHRIGRSDAESYAMNINKEEKDKLFRFFIESSYTFDRALHQFKNLNNLIYSTI